MRSSALSPFFGLSFVQQPNPRAFHPLAIISDVRLVGSQHGPGEGATGQMLDSTTMLRLSSILPCLSEDKRLYCLSLRTNRIVRSAREVQVRESLLRAEPAFYTDDSLRLSNASSSQHRGRPGFLLDPSHTRGAPTGFEASTGKVDYMQAPITFSRLH